MKLIMSDVYSDLISAMSLSINSNLGNISSLCSVMAGREVIKCPSKGRCVVGRDIKKNDEHRSTDLSNLPVGRKSICTRLINDCELLIKTVATECNPADAIHGRYMQTLQSSCEALVQVLPTYDTSIPSVEWLKEHCETGSCSSTIDLPDTVVTEDDLAGATLAAQVDTDSAGHMDANGIVVQAGVKPLCANACTSSESEGRAQRITVTDPVADACHESVVEAGHEAKNVSSETDVPSVYVGGLVKNGRPVEIKTAANNFNREDQDIAAHNSSASHVDEIQAVADDNSHDATNFRCDQLPVLNDAVPAEMLPVDVLRTPCDIYNQNLPPVNVPVPKCNREDYDELVRVFVPNQVPVPVDSVFSRLKATFIGIGAAVDNTHKGNGTTSAGAYVNDCSTVNLMECSTNLRDKKIDARSLESEFDIIADEHVAKKLKTVQTSSEGFSFWEGNEELWSDVPDGEHRSEIYQSDTPETSDTALYGRAHQVHTELEILQCAAGQKKSATTASM